MKKMVFSLFVLLVVFSPFLQPSSRAELLVTETGAVLFVNEQDEGTASGSILYRLADASKRVKKPLEIRMKCIYGNFAGQGFGLAGGKTWYELFREAVKGKDASNYEIIEIKKVIDGKNCVSASIWFFYIEKEKMMPLE